jgi:predicted phosphodiesterase
MKIGFISDIHEDIESLTKAINLLQQYQVDDIVCLGDIIGFAEPYYNNYRSTKDGKSCVDMVKKNCKVSVAGNHDLNALHKIPKNSPIIYPQNWYKLSSDERKAFSKNKIWFYEENEVPSNISEKQKLFLDNLCEYEKFITKDISIFLSHFIYPDLTGSAIHFPKNKRFYKKHFDFVAFNNCQISFTGHGHYEGIAISTKKSFKILPFGNYRIKTFPITISTPCIARSEIQNGITIFNTETYEINVIPLEGTNNSQNNYEIIK